jgi:proline dehydrogenase
MLPPIVSNFIAGESVSGAMEYVEEANENEISVILNLLGEHHSTTKEITQDVTTYRSMVDQITASEYNACLSVKPSQLGIDIDAAVFDQHLRDVVSDAAANDVFTWVDMEDSTTTDATLQSVINVAEDHAEQIGVCLQANLRRTPEDIEKLANLPVRVRLVKGAYDESEEIAYQSRAEIDEAYRDCITKAFEEHGERVAIGTHDRTMIDHAIAMHEQTGTELELQFLMGVRMDLQRELAKEYPVWQYAPFGDDWIQYFYRRVRERKENAFFAARAVVDQFL